MRTLVVGGRGHVGARVVASLEALGAGEVTLASRTSTPRLDVADASTFGCLDGHDVVVDCSDTTRGDAAALIEHCARRPVTLVEVGADAARYRAWLDRLGRVPSDAFRGRIVLGLGAYPGVSNVLAGAVLREVANPTSLDVWLSWSLCSGAGPGTCELMVDALRRPGVRVRDGVVVAGPPLGEVVATPGLDGVSHGVDLGFPEGVLLHASAGVPDVRTIVANRPAAPRALLRAVAWSARRSLTRGALAACAMRCGFRVVRAGLLARRTTAVHMRVEATGADGTRRAAELRAPDAFALVGHAVAVGSEMLLESPPPPGVVHPDRAFAIEPLVERINARFDAGITWGTDGGSSRPASLV